MVFDRKQNAHLEDPELLAEAELERLNKHNHTAPAPAASAPVPVPQNGDAPAVAASNGSGKSSFKEAKASRKKRCRGVSGSSIKKDGGRFDMGMEDMDGYDDVSDEDDGNDYAKYEAYARNASRGASDHWSDSEHSSESADVGGGKQVELVRSSLARAVKSHCADSALLSVADLLMDDFEEGSRLDVLDKAVAALVQDTESGMCEEAMGEYRLVVSLARMLQEGFLNRSAFKQHCHKLSGESQSDRLLLSAQSFFEGQASELKAAPASSPPTELSSLARELCESGELAGVREGLAQLDAPFFHAHFVYLTCVEAIGSMNMDVIYYTMRALKDLIVDKTLTECAVQIGINRFLVDIPDLEAEMDAVASLANLLVSYATNDFSLIERHVYEKCPQPKSFLLKRRNSCGHLSVIDRVDEITQGNYFVEEE